MVSATSCPRLMFFLSGSSCTCPGPEDQGEATHAVMLRPRFRSLLQPLLLPPFMHPLRTNSPVQGRVSWHEVAAVVSPAVMLHFCWAREAFCAAVQLATLVEAFRGVRVTSTVAPGAAVRQQTMETGFELKLLLACDHTQPLLLLMVILLAPLKVVYSV
mgnify:CR=1 FL=1